MAVTINQQAYDYANISIDISIPGRSFGIVGAGAESINYSTSFDREIMRGGSRLPVDTTDGEAEFEGSITFNRYWFDYIVAQAAEAGVGLGVLEMTIAVSYAKSPDVAIQTDTLSRVRFNGFDHSHDQGPDVLQVECDLHIMNIYYNGVDVFGGRL